MDFSKFKFYSLGIVAQNKSLSEDIAFITPIEVVPFIDGEIDSDIEQVMAAGVDKNNLPYTVSVNVDNAIEAQWLPLGDTNRRTAPDVRRGERVLLYRYADMDKYYWVSLGMDDHLRKLETVVYSWSDTQTEYPAKDSTEPDNCYWLEVSTHKKLITLKTVKADGEPFAYTLQLNTGSGYFTLTDDAGNFVELDSAETRIRFKNKDNTEIHLDKKKLYMNADEQVFIKSGNSTLELNPSGTILKTPRYDAYKA